jgi:phage/plasmid-like protein (TIGR03299 family)
MPAYFDTGFVVRQPAWHGLATVLDDYPRSISQARIDAGLTWEPELVPVYQKSSQLVAMSSDGTPMYRDTFVEVPNARMMQRNDTHDVIGYGMSDRYTPISNAEMFRVLEVLTQQGLKIETAGSVKGGSIVWALAYLDQPYTLPGDDSESFPYLAVVNSHDGKSSMRAMATQVRIVCMNTVQAAFMDSKRSGLFYDFRHKGGVQDRIDEAKQAIAGVGKDRDAWIAMANRLLGMRVSVDSYQAFVAEFLPEPPPGIASDRVRENVAQARRTFAVLYQGEQNAAVHGTALALVNTAVEYLDHARGYRNSDTYLGRTILKPEPLKAKAVQIAQAVCV